MPSEGKRVLKLSHAGAVLLLLTTCLFFASGAASSQDVKFKGPKAKKALFEDQQKEAAKRVKAYRYNPIGKTDPFRSFIAEQETLAEKTRRKPRTYLETLDISQLELTAIVVGPRGNFGMVRDAKGLGYVIRKGTYIGINGGVVQEIREKEVIIREGQRDISKKLHSAP